MKKCPTCKITKDLSCFNKNKAKKDGLNNCCSDCGKVSSRKHYLDNVEQRKKDAKERRIAAIAIIDDYISSLNRSCNKCGESHPACLDFHHVLGDTKEFNIATLRHHGVKLDRIKAEIAKCITLCSNCHRKHHYLQTLK